MILMLAPAAGMTFGAAPSGAAYVADQFGLVKVTNNNVADQTFLQTAGCFTLTPFGGWGTFAFNTLVDLYAADSATGLVLPGVTGFPQFTMVQIIVDGTPANDGSWAKTGTGHGSGNWAKVADTISSAQAAAIAAITGQQTTSVGAVNTAGATQVSAVNAAGGTQVAAVNAAGATQVAAIPSITDIQNAGGNKNYFPDPFFTNSSLAAGFTLTTVDKPYVFQGAWTSINDPDAASPYSAGKLLIRPSGNVTVPKILLYFDNMGLLSGDVIQIVQEMYIQGAGAAQTSGNYATLQFRDRAANAIGSVVNILVPTGGNPLDGTCRAFNSGNLTIPAGAAYAEIQYPQVAAITRAIASYQVVKVVNGNAAPGKPIQRPVVPDAINRIAAVEAHDPGNVSNGVLLRRSTYASASTAYPVGTTGVAQNTYSNNSGYGQSYLAAACPTLGFNMITTPINWVPDAARGVARVSVVVRTCATGSNPLNAGKTVAIGYIDTDPTTGTASGESIQLFDPVTGAPKTVMPSDLLALFSVAIISQNPTGATGLGSTQLYVTYAPHSNADPALLGYQAIAGGAGYSAAWSSVGGSTQSFVPQLTLAVSPVTAVKTPSATFAGAVGALVDEPPAIIALPKTVYCVVGREASVYYDAVQQRDAKRTNFSLGWSGAVPSASGGQEERIKYVPTAATTNTLTLSAYRGDLLSSTATCAFVSVAASAASGTRVVHFLGDSLIENAGMLAALRAISLEAGSVTSLTFIGSKGSAPLLNDGYSGMPLGAFRGAIIGGGANPFYNGTDFDYSYWKSHAGSGFAAADFVFIEAGGVDVGAPASDADAQAAAAAWAVHAEFIAASIHSASPSAKIVFYTKEAGPIPGQMPSPDPASSYGMLWRVRRNWKILAAKQISQFGSRSSDSIFVTPTAAAIDPENGWGRTLQPRNAAVTYNQTVYATYAAMVADLTKGAGTLAYDTDVASWFVKVGGAGLGRWRDARIEDGFIMRHSDTVHYANGSLQVAEANWALIKALG